MLDLKLWTLGSSSAAPSLSPPPGELGPKGFLTNERQRGGAGCAAPPRAAGFSEQYMTEKRKIREIPKVLQTYSNGFPEVQLQLPRYYEKVLQEYTPEVLQTSKI